MDPKIIEIKIAINIADHEQLCALTFFLNQINQIGCKTGGPATADFIPPQPSENPAPVSEEAPKPKRGRPRKESDSEPTAPEVPTPEAPVPETPAPAKEERVFKIEEVREKLKEKVGEHRETIKSKLNEFGVPNVSSLDPDNYPEFMEFLESLK